MRLQKNHRPGHAVTQPDFPSLSDLIEPPDLTDGVAKRRPPPSFPGPLDDLLDHIADEADDAPSGPPPDDIPDDSCPWGDCCAGWDGPVHRILDWREIERVYTTRTARLAATDKTRTTEVMEVFRSRGERRKLATIPTQWRAQLDDLYLRFPNFSKVIDYLRAAYALAERENGVPQLTPLLLDGPPGVGKSFFAAEYAKLLGSGFVTVRLEAAQTAAALTGSEEHWGNTKPGQLFNVLIERDFANPVIFVDEIDKHAGGVHDPLRGLFALLEPGTAQRFADASYPWVTLDASQVLWVCTSNDANVLPAPILDRLRRFAIAAPTVEQMRQLVQRMYEDLLADLPSVRTIELSSDAAERLVRLSPRRIRQVLREAIGYALYEGRQQVLERDVPVEGVERKRVGFLP